MQTIESTVQAYFDALGRSDVEAIVALFTEGGSLMADEEESWIGHETMRQALPRMFQVLTVEVAEVHFDDVREVGDIGVARTRTVDHIKLLATNTDISTPYRELFVLLKTEAGWRIADYMFNRLPAATG